MMGHSILVVLLLFSGCKVQGDDIEICRAAFGSQQENAKKGFVTVKTSDTTDTITTFNTKHLKQQLKKYERTKITCRTITPTKLLNRWTDIGNGGLLKPRNIRLESLDNVVVDTYCFKREKTVQSFVIGYLDEYSLDNLLGFRNVTISLHWKSKDNESKIEAMGEFSFCGEGRFHYHIYPQNNSMTVLQAYSQSPISWLTITAAYPSLEKKGGMTLWEHAYSRLKITESLKFDEKLKWYTLWTANGDTTAFFKSTRTAKTQLFLPAFGSFKANEEMLTFYNFEAITDYQGTINVHYSNFDMDFVTFARLVLDAKVLEVLDRVFSLKEMARFIKITQQVYMVGIFGELRPDQFDDFFLLSLKRNFLPFYIYGGSMKNEFYLQTFGKIVNDDAKPTWLDEGHVQFYVREFSDEDTIDFFIEFYTDENMCSKKKFSDFDAFTKKLESIPAFEKEVFTDPCSDCCQVVPSLKRITITTTKTFASMNSNKWHIDIQLRNKETLFKWKLKINETIQLEDFLM